MMEVKFPVYLTCHQGEFEWLASTFSPVAQLLVPLRWKLKGSRCRLDAAGERKISHQSGTEPRISGRPACKLTVFLTA